MTNSNKQKKNTKMTMTLIIIFVLLICTVPVAGYLYLSHSQQKNEKTLPSEQVISTKEESSESAESSSEDYSNSTDQTSDDLLESTQTNDENSEGMMQDTAISESTMSTEDMNQNTTPSSTENVDGNVGTYTVQPQDNLYRIALNHGMTQQELMDLNGLTSTDVNVGQVLKVKQ